MKNETIENPISYCLCTLAFGQSYRMAAKELATKAAESGIRLTVATDEPEDFKDHYNVTALNFTRTSIWKPYNDKRFAVAAALKDNECVILVDADSNILAELPKKINVEPGMTAYTAYKSLEEDLILHHAQENLEGFRQLAKKLHIDLAQTKWVAENLVIIRRDGGKEWQFLDTWAFADRYLGIRKVFQGDHGFIGVSAASVGWQVKRNDDFNQLKSIIKNMGRDSLEKRTKPTYLTKTKSRIMFHYLYYKALFNSLLNYDKYWS
ncbi:hypothetical protein [Okeania sp.]|uniref:hypothetical protein n=1 Tax=Okeania sp. TaxID=3100323 RepID=UPI002B4B61F0|nr:hypothetical protein [Okeania sp.]MEB3342146.1 hypothetical protein [Okeania sp.]